ncbi:MAG: ATP-binding protein [Rhodospirillales bacterium]|nr:ATP-binding protein [Rhodospirillales bacterium]
MLRRLEMFAKQFRNFPALREVRAALEDFENGEIDEIDAQERIAGAVDQLVDDVATKSGDGMTSVRHLQTVIGDILDFSKLEAGKLRIDIAPAEIGPVVADVLPSIEPLASAGEVSLHIETPPGLVARADAHRLSQIVLNLLSNAVKFTDPGGSVSLKAVALENAVEISVRDTGIGIEADQLETIFGAFEQVDDPLSRRSGGTGLGLPIARQLLGLMGGDIGVESEPGTGSTFTVTLPNAGVVQAVE